MQILELRELDKRQIEDIKNLEGICQKYDKTKGSVFLSNEINFSKEINCFFLLYEEETLVSFVSMFIPRSKEAEVSAYTLPEKRKKGFFKILLESAINELRKYGVKEILFVHETSSNDGMLVLKKFNAIYDFSEYLLVYRQDEFIKRDGKLKLAPITIQDIDEIAKLNMDIFNKTLEEGKAIVNRAIESKDRISYMAKVDNEIVGICSISLEGGNAFICGLGISTKYRGLGYGKEILSKGIEKALTLDIKDIYLEVDSKNHTAYNLYINNGFIIKTQLDYYRYII
ncbi:GNAT family N-acetyltransferase [Clostridium sp.]|uniref:GNAT family N-acetyltransferase n=1 Tax=Clostridium sp. TaxID=1506 RepID=UPI00321744DD